MTEILNAREASNRWYGTLTEGDYQNTVDDFAKFLEQEALPKVPREARSTFLDELKRWVPDQKATIESFGFVPPATNLSQEESRRALLVVDMQNGFAKRGGLIYVEQAEKQISMLRDAVVVARSACIPVVYTKVLWESSEDVVTGLKNNLPSLEGKWNSEGGFRPGSWGAEIVDELKPEDHDYITAKRAFSPPNLVELLKRNEPGVREIFVVGTTANNCVYAACLALFEAGYQVKAIRDGISSFGEHSREPWLANIDKYLGDVITLEQFDSILSRPSTHSVAAG